MLGGSWCQHAYRKAESRFFLRHWLSRELDWGSAVALPRVLTIRPICIEGNHFRLGPKYTSTQIGHNFSNIDANDLIPSRIERGDTAESIPHTFRPQKVKNGEVLPFSSYGRVGGPKKN